MKQEIARLRDELAETKRNHENQTLEAAKRSAISAAMARAKVSNPNEIYEQIAGKIIQNHDGRWVAEENGVTKFGPDEGYVYSLDRMIADLSGSASATNPSSTSAPTSKPVLDPKHPRFNATAATLYARSCPEAMSELMANLSPTRVRTF